jgi:tryptophan synthase alpha chain
VLEQYLKDRRQKQEILLMTHIVLGHPHFDTSLRLVESMVHAGVDLIELQIPFSEPMADGPVILRANQEALEAGSTVDKCFEVATEVARRFDVPFLFMSYYNVLFRRGVAEFVNRSQQAGLRGAMKEAALDPIFIYSPNTTDARLKVIAQHASGFVYCVARKGVTGSATAFSTELSSYLARARAATTLPLAVGFGVKEKPDVDFLRGKADIAVVGSETLRVLERGGVAAVGPFLEGLR